MLEEAASPFQAVQVVINRPGAHSRLKLLGFTDLGSLRHFLDAPAHAMQIADYDLNLSIKLLKSLEPEVIGSMLSVVANLKQITRDWINLVFNICDATHWTTELDAGMRTHHIAVRIFRRDRPWPIADYRQNEFFDCWHSCDRTVLFYGLRRSPDGKEQVLIIAYMEGVLALVVTYLPIPGIAANSWPVALTASGLVIDSLDVPVIARDRQSMVLTRQD